MGIKDGIRRIQAVAELPDPHFMRFGSAGTRPTALGGWAEVKKDDAYRCLTINTDRPGISIAYRLSEAQAKMAGMGQGHGVFRTKDSIRLVPLRFFISRTGQLSRHDALEIETAVAGGTVL